MTVLLLSLFLAAAPALADDGAPSADQWESAPEADLPPPGPPPAASEVNALAYRVAKGLRCPVCQGLSVADSPSETAVTMKNRVHDLVAAGYTEAQIHDYFVGRYGEWVLLDPPSDGLNLVLWAVPLGGLALVGAFLLLRARRARPVAEASASPAPVDDYAARLLAEADE